MSCSFIPEIERTCIVERIKQYFEDNGPDCKAIIGMSGGKDSTIAAALCAEALGSNRVIGVMLPFEGQDTKDAREVIRALGIDSMCIDITTIYDEAMAALVHKDICVSKETEINLLPRIRMTMLMAVAQSLNGRLICTSNASERYLGYFTMYGDECGTCKPLIDYTVTELKQIGYTIDTIRNELIDKIPSDDISGKTDEEAFGFSYEEIDNHIRLGISRGGERTSYFKQELYDRHKKNLFKIDPNYTYYNYNNKPFYLNQ